MTWTPGVSKQMHWTCMYFLVLSKALGISCNPSYCRFTFPKPARKTGGDAGRAGRTSSPSCSSSDCGEPRNGPLARCQQGRNHEGNEGNNQGFEWFCAETTVCLRIRTQNCLEKQLRVGSNPLFWDLLNFWTFAHRKILGLQRNAPQHIYKKPKIVSLYVVPRHPPPSPHEPLWNPVCESMRIPKRHPEGTETVNP